jgi:hypothetical protein
MLMKMQLFAVASGGLEPPDATEGIASPAAPATVADRNSRRDGVDMGHLVVVMPTW